MELLLTLPDEILLEILKRIDKFSLMKVVKENNKLQRFLREVSLVRTSVFCARCGFDSSLATLKDYCKLSGGLITSLDVSHISWLSCRELQLLVRRLPCLQHLNMEGLPHNDQETRSVISSTKLVSIKLSYFEKTLLPKMSSDCLQQLQLLTFSCSHPDSLPYSHYLTALYGDGIETYNRKHYLQREFSAIDDLGIYFEFFNPSFSRTSTKVDVFHTYFSIFNNVKRSATFVPNNNYHVPGEEDLFVEATNAIYISRNFLSDFSNYLKKNKLKDRKPQQSLRSYLKRLRNEDEDDDDDDDDTAPLVIPPGLPEMMFTDLALFFKISAINSLRPPDLDMPLLSCLYSNQLPNNTSSREYVFQRIWARMKHRLIIHSSPFCVISKYHYVTEHLLKRNCVTQLMIMPCLLAVPAVPVSEEPLFKKIRVSLLPQPDTENYKSAFRMLLERNCWLHYLEVDYHNHHCDVMTNFNREFAMDLSSLLLIPRLRHLRYLTLCVLPAAPKALFTEIFSNCPLLSHLTLNCSTLKVKDVEEVIMALSGGKAIKFLRFLDSPSQLTNLLIERAASCPQLEELYCSEHGTSPTELHFPSLKQLLEQCRRLVKVIICPYAGLTAARARKYAQHTRTLKAINKHTIIALSLQIKQIHSKVYYNKLQHPFLLH